MAVAAERRQAQRLLDRRRVTPETETLQTTGDQLGAVKPLAPSAVGCIFVQSVDFRVERSHAGQHVHETLLDFGISCRELLGEGIPFDFQLITAGAPRRIILRIDALSRGKPDISRAYGGIAEEGRSDQSFRTGPG